MPYPPTALPTDKTNSTALADDHAPNHNNVNGAVNQIVTELGSGPKGTAADLTARLATMDSLLIPEEVRIGHGPDPTATGLDLWVDLDHSTSGSDLSNLHSALLAVKVWNSSLATPAYVWSGDGTAPDSSAYTQILFIDPAGTHDPTTSPGGRSNINDLWETGSPGTNVIAIPYASWPPTSTDPNTLYLRLAP